MLAILLVTATTASVPTPSQAMLVTRHPADWTRQLLAQAAERDEEIDALERDMQRSRERLGNPKPAEAPPPATSAPAQAPSAPQHAPNPRYRATYEGHSRGYFLAWGIVDWVLAGQLWGVAAYGGLGALIFTTVAAGERDAGLLALIYGVVAIGSAGLGGLAAWRAVTNVRIYRDLKAEEQYHRSGPRAGPRR